MSEADNSQESAVHLIRYGTRETATLLLKADSLNIMTNDDGSLALELFDFDAKGREHKGYRLTFSAEDVDRLKTELRRS